MGFKIYIVHHKTVELVVSQLYRLASESDIKQRLLSSCNCSTKLIFNPRTLWPARNVTKLVNHCST